MNKIVKRQQKDKALLLEQFKRTPIIQIACDKTGVARATYYRWIKEDPLFAKEADDALAQGVSLINDMAESQLISSIRDKSLSAIIYWLKHRHPAYTNKLEIMTRKAPDAPLTSEQQQLIDKAIELAGIPSLELNEEEHDKPSA